MTSLDLRFLSGPAMLVLGVCFLILAARLWWVHPVNRVFRIGRYVTEEGIRAVVRLRVTFIAFGSFLTFYGLASVVFWFTERGVFDPLVQFLGSLGAGLGVWAAGMALLDLWRLWKLR